MSVATGACQRVPPRLHCGPGTNGTSMTTPRQLSPATRAAQALRHVDPVTGGVTPAIELSSTFARDDDYGPRQRFIYARDGGPTVEHAEAVLADLDGAAASLLFASGMAAMVALTETLQSGDRVAAPRVMYHGGLAWLRRLEARRGIGLDLFDAADPEALAGALRPGETRLVWIETPTNPTWEVIDIAAAARAAHGGAGATRGRLHGGAALHSRSARPRRGRGISLRDQVSRRALRSDRRGAEPRRRGRARRGSPPRAVADGQRDRAVRGVAADPRHPHAVSALRARERDGAGDRPAFRGPPAGGAGALPRAGQPSGPRAGGPADDRRLRRHAVAAGRRRRAARPATSPASRRCSCRRRRSAAWKA